MHLEDLSQATEIVLSAKSKVRPIGRRRGRAKRGSTRRAVAGAIGVGSTVGAAITNRRILGPAEAKLMAVIGLLLLALAAIAILWPRVIAVPLAVIGIWIAVALLVKAYKLHGRGESAPLSQQIRHSQPKEMVGRNKNF